MIDAAVRSVLDEAGVRYCLIGAHALALHGVARYTADVDILTLNSAVLDPWFWPGALQPSVRRGDPGDPLAGVVRFSAPALDVVVGRGRVMRRALDEAVEIDLAGIPVATAFWLALLKLDAGGVQDIADVTLLCEARRRAGEDLRSRLDAAGDLLSTWGREALKRLPQPR